MIKSADITDKLIMYFIEHGMQIITGIGIIVAGLFCARWAGNVALRWLEKHKLEPQVRQLVTKLVRLFVFAVFAVMALGQMGVQITPLLAGVGVAGVGLSLATQSVLGNLVAGLNIIFSKPFTVGEDWFGRFHRGIHLGPLTIKSAALTSKKQFIVFSFPGSEILHFHL